MLLPWRFVFTDLPEPCNQADAPPRWSSGPFRLFLPQQSSCSSLPPPADSYTPRAGPEIYHNKVFQVLSFIREYSCHILFIPSIYFLYPTHEKSWGARSLPQTQTGCQTIIEHNLTHTHTHVHTLRKILRNQPLCYKGGNLSTCWKLLKYRENMQTQGGGGNRTPSPGGTSIQAKISCLISSILLKI